MKVFMAQCNYFPNCYFGLYSTREKARQAIINFFSALNAVDRFTYEKTDDTCLIYFKDGKQYLATIRCEIVDEDEE